MEIHTFYIFSLLSIIHRNAIFVRGSKDQIENIQSLRVKLIGKCKDIEDLLVFSSDIRIPCDFEDSKYSSISKDYKEETYKTFKENIKSAINLHLLNIQENIKMLNFSNQDYSIDSKIYDAFINKYECLSLIYDKYKEDFIVGKITIKKSIFNFTKSQDGSCNKYNTICFKVCDYEKILNLNNAIAEFINDVGKILFCDIYLELFEIFNFNKYFPVHYTQLEKINEHKGNKKDFNYFENLVMSEFLEIKKTHKNCDVLNSLNNQIYLPESIFRSINKYIKNTAQPEVVNLNYELLNENNQMIVYNVYNNIIWEYRCGMDLFKLFVNRFKKYDQKSERHMLDSTLMQNIFMNREEKKENILKSKAKEYYLELQSNISIILLILKKRITLLRDPVEKDIIGKYKFLYDFLKKTHWDYYIFMDENGFFK
ncbi:hypothetical protein H312_02787 [Anncaliia algerae PRA339]|uniref:Uncharacterized protein n=1 Tax=Anncaliia algerae PRA339 TaxID=1288291 RepID=A0A059EYJ6_9MICR|nr:hypothetical protein H312_02787 [Anncaliia algerae PRA339]